MNIQLCLHIYRFKGCKISLKFENRYIRYMRASGSTHRFYKFLIPRYIIVRKRWLLNFINIAHKLTDIFGISQR